VPAGTLDLPDIVQGVRLELADFNRNLRHLQSGMDDAGDRTRRLGGFFDGLGRTAGSVFGTMGRAAAGFAVAAGAALGAAGAYGLNAAADFQQTRIAFEGLLGDAQLADTFLRDMREFAARTPFELPGVLEAAQRLLAMGRTTEEVIPILTTLGDTVAALGGGEAEISRIALAFGQIESRGRVALEEINQISEAVPGFSALGAIAEAFGVTTGEAMDMISAGAIPAREGIDAILAGMAEMPGAVGGMQRQSETLNGVLSTLKDNFRNALIDGIEPFLPAITDVVNALAPLASAAPGGVIGGVTFALGKLNDLFTGGLVGAFRAFRDGLNGDVSRAMVDLSQGTVWNDLTLKVFDLGMALRGIADYVRENWPQWRDTAVEVFNTVRTAIETAVNWITENWPIVRDTIVNTWNDDVLPVLQAVSDFITVHVIGAWEELQGAFDRGRERFDLIMEDIRSIADQVTTWFDENWPRIAEIIETVATEAEPIIANFVDVITAALGAITAFIDNVFMPFWRLFGDDFVMVVGAWLIGTTVAINGLLDVLEGLLDFIANVFRGDMSAAFDGLAHAIGGSVDLILGTLLSLLAPAIGLLHSMEDLVIEPLKTAFGGIWTSLTDLYDDVTGWIEDFLSAFTGLVDRMPSFSGLFNGIRDAFRSAVNFIIDAWNGLEFSIPGFDPPGPGPSWGGVTIGTPNIDRLATGGVITHPMVALVGDQPMPMTNPEIVSPRSMMADTFREVLGGWLGGGPLIGEANFYDGTDVDLAAQHIGAQLLALGAS
jgi:tape measure domain-containing protein